MSAVFKAKVLPTVLSFQPCGYHYFIEILPLVCLITFQIAPCPVPHMSHLLETGEKVMSQATHPIFIRKTQVRTLLMSMKAAGRGFITDTKAGLQGQKSNLALSLTSGQLWSGYLISFDFNVHDFQIG